MTPQLMQSAREQIERQTAEFLATGKQIQRLPTAWDQSHQRDDSNWISTAEAARLIGVSVSKLSKWRATNASAPRSRREGKEVEWFRPSVVTFAETYSGRRRAA